MTITEKLAKKPTETDGDYARRLAFIRLQKDLGITPTNYGKVFGFSHPYSITYDKQNAKRPVTIADYRTIVLLRLIEIALGKEAMIKASERLRHNIKKMKEEGIVLKNLGLGVNDDDFLLGEPDLIQMEGEM